MPPAGKVYIGDYMGRRARCLRCTHAVDRKADTAPRSCGRALRQGVKARHSRLMLESTSFGPPSMRQSVPSEGPEGPSRGQSYAAGTSSSGRPPSRWPCYPIPDMARAATWAWRLLI